VEGFDDCPQSLQDIPEEYLNYVTTVSLRILSASQLTSHSITDDTQPEILPALLNKQLSVLALASYRTVVFANRRMTAVEGGRDRGMKREHVMC
jgi:hypothetical protein